MGFLSALSFRSRDRDATAEAAAQAGTIKDRKAERHELMGAVMYLLVDATKYKLHLKDLSSTGVSGMTDAPLALNQTVILYLTKQQDPVAVQIRWIRRTMIGAAFLENVSEEAMQGLLRGHKARKN
nr:PilZ domain-containing protein [uncultured Sphingosinicella sp.]